MLGPQQADKHPSPRLVHSRVWRAADLEYVEESDGAHWTEILLTSHLEWCRRPELVAAAAEGAALVCALPLEEVAAFSSLRINLSQDLRGADQRRANLQVRLCEQVCRGVFILGPDDFPLPLIFAYFWPSSGRDRAILNSQSLPFDACMQVAMGPA